MLCEIPELPVTTPQAVLDQLRGMHIAPPPAEIFTEVNNAVNSGTSALSPGKIGGLFGIYKYDSNGNRHEAGLAVVHKFTDSLAGVVYLSHDWGSQGSNTKVTASLKWEW